MRATCASLFLLVIAASTANAFQKRHSECFSYNVQGCQYPIVGSNGAAVSEVGTCSEIAIDILEQGGNAADGEPLRRYKSLVHNL